MIGLLVSVQVQAKTLSKGSATHPTPLVDANPAPPPLLVDVAIFSNTTRTTCARRIARCSLLRAQICLDLSIKKAVFPHLLANSVNVSRL